MTVLLTPSRKDQTGNNDVETTLSQEWCEQEVGVSDADSSRIDP